MDVYSEIIMPRIYGKSLRMSLSIYRPEYYLCDEANVLAWCAMGGYHKSSQMMALASSKTSTMKHLIRLQQEEASQYMHRSMRIINRRFQQSKEILSSSTVIAVSTLVICAALSDEPEACKTHHNGLIKLVELRGGIDTFSRPDAFHLSR